MAKWSTRKWGGDTPPIKEDEPRPIDLIFPERRQSMSAGRCMPAPIGCGRAITAFRDELSQREYRISGLCQSCQDTIFKPAKGDPHVG